MLAELLLALSLTTKYPGPLGIDWGKSPPEATTLIGKRLTLVEEVGSEVAGFETTEQRYSGKFGGLDTTEIKLLFHRGEFFYLAVTLAAPEPGAAARAFEAAVRKMTKAYGAPQRRIKAPQVSSRKAILENVPLENRGWVLPLLWNEQTKGDVPSLHALRELQIRVGMWDPFAAWRFRNGVSVQSFIYRFRSDGVSTSDPAKPATLVPIWIFSKDDRLAAWKKAKREAKMARIVEPRDY